MSQWGKLDRLVIPGTVIANLDSKTVVTSQDQTGNIQIGYALVLGNVDYVVANVINGTTYTLDVVYEGANTQGAPTFVAVQQQPKTLKTYGFGANTVNARNVYGIDYLEANVASNKAKGFSHTGWMHYQTWVNSQGTTRNRAEVLVAMSKNFNANATGVLQTDANDDTPVSDWDIVVTSQPSLNGRQANAQFFGASYSVAASGTRGGVVSYQWQKSPNGIVWTNVVDAPYAGNAQFTGNTTSNVYISNVYATAGTVNIYIRAILSGNSAQTVTTDNVQVYVGQSQ